MQTQEANHRLKRQYKGYIIEVTAVPLRPKGFTAHLNIIKDSRAHIDDTPIHSGKVFSIANDALEAGVEVGKQKIDEGFRPTTIVLDK